MLFLFTHCFNLSLNHNKTILKSNLQILNFYIIFLSKGTVIIMPLHFLLVILFLFIKENKVILNPVKNYLIGVTAVNSHL